MTYTSYDDAKSDLLAQGFARYLSPIDGAERFSKPSKVDAFYGAYARDCVAFIQRHWVAPQWGDERNFYTVEFI